MDKRFQWTEFYMELASALLPYKNNRSELIAKLKTIFADAGMNFPFKVLYALKDFLIKQLGSLLEHTT